MKPTTCSVDALDNGDVQIAIFRGDKGRTTGVLTGIPKRQARALANRILHEIDFAEGKRSRRPSTPHLFWAELLPCLDCGRKNATGCAGRSGRTCPLSTIGAE